MSSPNIQLLKKTLAHIENHPRLWVQETWRTETDCGTAYCFAGWAAHLTGAKFCADWEGHFLIPQGEEHERFTGDYASEVLGIAPWEDDEPHLFHEDNTLDDLRRIVSELCEEAADATR